MTQSLPFTRRRLAHAVAIAAAIVGVNAHAGVAAGLLPDSSVDTNVVDLGNGNQRYEYTVNNESDFANEVAANSVDGFVAPPPERGDGPLIVDWELPWFNGGAIDPNTIQSPAGWSFAIEDVGTANPERGWGGIAGWQEAGDPFNDFLNDIDQFGQPFDNGLTDEQQNAFLNVTQVLHWYIAPDFWADSSCSGTVEGNGDFGGGCGWGWNEDSETQSFPGLAAAILPFNSLGGFSFEAPASDPLAAPYQASWFQLPVRTGDPPFPDSGTPASGLLPTSGLPRQTADVPEPATLGLAGLALAGGLLARRRRRA